MGGSPSCTTKMIGVRNWVLLALVGSSLAVPQLSGGGFGRAGGLSSIRASDLSSTVPTLVRNVRTEVEGYLGYPLRDFTPKGYREQTVAGTVYFVKVNTGSNNKPGQRSDEYFHLRIYENLQNCACLEGVEQGKGQFSVINHFDKQSQFTCSQCTDNGDNGNGGFVPGGLFNEKAADSNVRNLVNRVRDEIGHRLRYEPSNLQAVKYKEQLIAGYNYFVKVDIGFNRPGQTSSDYIHVFIHEDLNGNVCVLGVEQFKGEFDTIDHINPDSGATSCTPSEINVNGEVFEVLRDHPSVSWDEARRLCRDRGMDLAQPDTQNIVQLASRLRNEFGLTYYWLGGKGTGGDIVWIYKLPSSLGGFEYDSLWRDATHRSDKSSNKCLYIRDDAGSNPMGMYPCNDTNYLTPLCQ